MKTIKILTLLMAICGGAAFGQDTLNPKMREMMDRDKAAQLELQKAKAIDSKKVVEAKKAEEKRKAEGKESPAPAEMSAEDKAMMAYMTPGEMQKLLAESVGEWNEKVTFWSAPGAPPMVSTAKCTTTMILGGRYQKSVSKGKMMGMNFEGQSTMGYDNMLKEFQSTWIDNFGTGIMTMSGKYDPETKTFTLVGKSVDPVSNTVLDARETTKIVSKTEMVMEMFVTRGGKEFKTMEIVFTRPAKKK